MARRNYDKIYEERKEEEVVEEPVKKPKTKKTVEEEPVKEEKADKIGKVLGEANLNVRKTPAGEIITHITPGTQVVIVGEANEDWFEISNPVPGFVMKKFIEV